MRKLCVLLIGAVLAMAAFGGCHSAGAMNSGSVQDNFEAADTTGSADADGGRLRVVASFFAPYDFVREIAGDRVDHTMLLPPGSESHVYEPTPQDIISIQNSDVFLYAGGESDAWLDRILETMDTTDMRALSMMDMVDTVTEELVEGMDHEHGEDEHEAAEYDEHVWTSPKNAQIIVANIAEALAEADPVNADSYRRNAEAYLEKLKALDASFQEVVAGAARKTIVFGDRFPFRYLADAYGLEYYAAFPGCSTETEASASTVAFLIDKVKDEGIPAVFHIELSSEKMADTICEGTGAEKLLLHSCHNVTKSDFESGVTYLSLMEENAENLKKALE